MRFLLLIALVLAGVWLIRRALGAGSAKRGATPAPPPAAGEPGELVGCARCGLLLPRAEATAAQGALYCGEDHARLGPR